MKLYFIRHGFAYHNLAFEQVGEKAINDPKYMDAQLTPVGEKQAREAGKKLMNIKFNRIYCSPLVRSIQTLDNLLSTSHVIMNTVYSAPKNEFIVLDDRLLESQNKISSKRHEKVEIEKYVARYNKKFDLSNVALNYYFKKESDETLKNRIKSFILDLKKIHTNNENILIVTHYYWLYNFFELATGTGYNFNNCEIKVVSI